MTQNKKYTLIAYLILLLFAVSEKGVFASSKLGSARARIEIFEERLLLMQKDIGRFPTTEEGLKALITAPSNVSSWQGPYVPYGLIPTDPWGQAYVYHYQALYGTKQFDLYSKGPNSLDEKGEGDDITNWQRKNTKGDILLLLIVGLFIVLIVVLYLRLKNRKRKSHEIQS